MSSVYQNTRVQVTSSSPVIPANGSSVSVNGCVVVKFTDHAPWDHPDDLVSAATEQLVDRVKAAVVVPACFFVGGIGNCVNLVVFCKQGLHDRINMCLFTLAFLDLLYLCFGFFIYGERISAMFQSLPRIGPVYEFAINNHILGLYGVGWTPFFMASVIASERCFCIVNPLLSKTALKTRTLAIFVGICCFLTSAGYFAVSEKYAAMCIYKPESNSTVTQLTTNAYYRQNKKMVDAVDLLVYGLLLPGIGNIVVAVCTVAMTVHLKRTVAWRRNSSSAVSTKEIVLTKMLICLCIEFNVFSSANVPFRITSVFVDDLSGSGRYYNTYFLMRSVIEMLSFLNSSLHVFVYLTFGSKYRETLKTICGRHRRAKKQNSVSRLQEVCYPQNHL